MQNEIKERIKEFQNQLNETNVKLENLTIRRHQLEGAIFSLQGLLASAPAQTESPESPKSQE